jgi:serine/threonine protein phosphatase PrpC
MLDIEFAEISDFGRVRKDNEDCLGCVIPSTPAEARARGWLFALADGVGGQGGGEIASQTAIETLVDGFRNAGKSDSLSALLQRLIQGANARVFETAMNAEIENKGMATTLVACALRYDRAAIAHVGDSRCYLVRNGEARVLTRDHTVASDQARIGLLSEDKIAHSDSRHILTRSLGSNLVAGVEITDQQVYPGDVLLLCSDGLHGAVRTHEIATIVSAELDLNVAARQLVALAVERDGSDNASAQLIRVRSVERVGMYRGRPYKLH